MATPESRTNVRVASYHLLAQLQIASNLNQHSGQHRATEVVNSRKPADGVGKNRWIYTLRSAATAVFHYEKRVSL